MTYRARLQSNGGQIDMKMRLFLATFFLVVAGSVPRADAGAVYPWCALYGYYGVTNCGFYTLAQCQAAVSGNGGFCQRNGFYAGPAPDEAPPMRAQRRSLR